LSEKINIGGQAVLEGVMMRSPRAFTVAVRKGGKPGAEIVVFRQELKPLDIVLPDQFIDRTRGRISTFFGRGLAAHVGFARPLCPTLSALAHDPARGRLVLRASLLLTRSRTRGL